MAAPTKNLIYFTPEGSPVAPDKFDTRVRMRNLSKGLITRETLEKHLNALPDDTDAGEYRSFDSIVNEEVAAEETNTDGSESGPITH